MNKKFTFNKKEKILVKTKVCYRANKRCQAKPPVIFLPEYWWSMAECEKSVLIKYSKLLVKWFVFK
jgi:hypothetical protein